MATFPKPPDITEEEGLVFEDAISRQRHVQLQVLGFSDEQLNTIKMAAEKKGLTPYEFVVKYAMVSAETILLERANFQVTPEVYEKMMDVLDRAPRELPALRAMIERNRESRFKLVSTPEIEAANDAALKDLAEAASRRQHETSSPED